MQLLFTFFCRYLSPFLEYFASDRRFWIFLQGAIPPLKIELWQQRKILRMAYLYVKFHNFLHFRAVWGERIKFDTTSVAAMTNIKSVWHLVRKFPSQELERWWSEVQQTDNFQVIKKNILLLYTLLIHTSICVTVYTISAAAIVASLAVRRSIYGRCTRASRHRHGGGVRFDIYTYAYVFNRAIHTSMRFTYCDACDTAIEQAISQWSYALCQIVKRSYWRVMAKRSGTDSFNTELFVTEIVYRIVITWQFNIPYHDKSKNNLTRLQV